MNAALDCMIFIRFIIDLSKRIGNGSLKDKWGMR